MSKRGYNTETLKFLVIAVGLMLIVFFISEKLRFFMVPPAPPPPVEEQSKIEIAPGKPRALVLRNVKTIDITEPLGMSVPKIEETIAAYEEHEPPPPPRPKARKTIQSDGRTGKVVIIIDDMGLTQSRDNTVVGMPGPLTLAYLPYAPGVAGQALEARAAGHELLVHTPMEPMNGRTDPGPIALTTGMDEATFKKVLREQVLPAFEGYVGINNHMGSRLTQDAQAMEWVMEEMKARDLVFVDSVTIKTSIAAAVAQAYEVPFAERDVFLDHHESRAAVEKSLAELERRAKDQGYAVGIGHPKPHTIAALKEWLPTLKERGLELVPVSSVLEKPWENETRTALKR